MRHQAVVVLVVIPLGITTNALAVMSSAGDLLLWPPQAGCFKAHRVVDMYRALTAGAAGVLALGLAGCAPTSIDQAAAHEWLDRVSAHNDIADDWIGSASGIASSRDNAAGVGPDGVTFTFDDPQTVSAADVMCFGGVNASVDVQIEAETFGGSVQTQIPCDEQTHHVRISDSGEMQGVTAVSVSIHTEMETTYYAGILP